MSKTSCRWRSKSPSAQAVRKGSNNTPNRNSKCVSLKRNTPSSASRVPSVTSTSHMKKRQPAGESLASWMKPPNAVTAAVKLFLSAQGSAGSEVLELLSDGKSERYLNAIPSIPELIHSYPDPVEFEKAYQAWYYLKKDPMLVSSIDTRLAAYTTFKECEQICEETNWRLRYQPNMDLMSRLKRKMRLLLGSLTTRDFSVILDSGRFGPGVSSSCKGARVSYCDKIASLAEATPDLIRVGAHLVIGRHRAWSLELTGSDGGDVCPLPSALSSVPGNTLTFVPKDATTDRPIAVEPTVNQFVQLAIGGLIRKRLKRHGVDLNDQSVNQKLALQGSIDNSLATIDLKSASDTIARVLVEELSPNTWISVLRAARSPLYMDPYTGVWLPYRKWSSMGNGYTFELESAIFASCVLVAAELCSVEVSFGVNAAVYGDDLIVPSAIAPKLLEILHAAGFKENPKKTFLTGPFRESCGADYFNGRPVRPIFKKEPVYNAASAYRMANAIRGLAARRNRGLGCDGDLFRSWRALYYSVPEAFRFRVPANAGPDAGFWSELDEAVSSTVSRVRRRQGRWAFTACRFKSVSRRVETSWNFDGTLQKSIPLTHMLFQVSKAQGTWGLTDALVVRPEDHESSLYKGLPLRDVGSLVRKASSVFDWVGPGAWY